MLNKISKRLNEVKHPLGKRIVKTMLEKQSNLTFSADVDHMDDLLSLADKLGPHIICLKTHIDCLEDFSFEKIKALQKLSQKHNFFIFEDRKFADIGHTSQRQFTGGIYKIAEWAHIVNAHGICGETLVESLKSCLNPSEQALLLLANMSQAKSLFTPDYSQEVIKLAQKHEDTVCGFIAPNLKVPESFLNFSPGVNLNATQDTKGQRYKKPDSLKEFGVDSPIVGRGILKASDPIEAAKEYQQTCWNLFTT